MKKVSLKSLRPRRNRKKIMAKVEVTYWRGTTQHRGIATTYRGAMRIAKRNQNAWPPTFRDAETGKHLEDIGGVLCESEPDSKGCLIAVV